jgi:hypothetical protein
MLSYALVAGLNMTEALELPPGLICDLYVYRMRYDDMEHGVKRKRQARCAD